MASLQVDDGPRGSQYPARRQFFTGNSLADLMLPEFSRPSAIMLRLIWLALFCLAALGGLSVVRSVIGPGAAANPAPTTPATNLADFNKPLAKGDRLGSHYMDNGALRQAGLDALKNAVMSADSSKRDAAADNVVSWQWHEGSKIVRRRRSN